MVIVQYATPLYKVYASSPSQKTLKKHEKTNIRLPFSKLNYPNLSPIVTIYGLSRIRPEFWLEFLYESGKSGSGRI